MATNTDTYNPFAERNLKHPTTNFDTFVHLVKGSLGAGIMAMPIAFHYIGLWLGVPGLVFVCFMATYCIHMLVRASQTLCFRCRVPRLSYADTAEQALRNDPKELIKWAITLRFIVSFALVINSIGCICIYFVNTGRHMEQVLNEHFPNNNLCLRLCIVIVACPMLLLSLIRDLKYLVPISLVANIFIFVSLIITFCFIFDGLPNPNQRTAVTKIDTWPTFFSISIFALENVGVILPCENEMKTPEHFTGCPSVLVAAMCVVGFLYTSLGFFGYLKYGDMIEANISLNLPITSHWAEAAKIMIAFAVYFTILIQFYVAMQIVWQGLESKVPENWQNLTEACVRIGLMFLCAAIAAGFPKLGPLISLVGAVCFSTLGFTLPAIIDLIVIRIDPGYGPFKIHLIKDILIITFGLSVFIGGSIESIKEFEVTPLIYI